MKILKFPFLSLSVFFVAGILTYPFFDKTFLLWSVFTLAFLNLVLWGSKIFVSSYQRLIYWVSYAILFWSLGFLVTHLHDIAYQQQHFTHHHAADKKDFLRLVIVERVSSSAYANRYVAAVKNCNSKQTFGNVLIVRPRHYEQELFKVGEILTVYQKINVIPPPRNPNQFNYRLYLEQHGIYGQVYLDNQNFKSEGTIRQWVSAVATWRDFLIESFDIHAFSPDVSAFVNALLFGQKQDLSLEIKNNFRDVGVIHVLAISGLHIGIIYSVLQQLLKRLGFRTKYIPLITLLVLWLFALISGFAAPVLRAVLMFTIWALTQGKRRASTLYNSLAIALVMMLCFNPNYIYEVGFQLSFLAVFSIVFFYPLFAPFVSSKWLLLQYFKEIIAVSLAVQMGILPLQLYYFHQVPWLFLIGNMIVIPLVTLIIVVLLLVLVLNFVWKTGAIFIGGALAFIINALYAVVLSLSQGAVYNLKGVPFNAVLALVCSLLLLWVVYGVKKQRKSAIALVVTALFVFQMSYMFFALVGMQKAETLLLYHRNHLTFLFKKPFKINVVSTDTAVWQSSMLADYGQRNFLGKSTYTTLENLMKVGDKRLLIVDSLGSYKTAISADILLFSGRPKINFTRVLEYHNPSLVVVNSDFPFWESKRIAQWCFKKNIPFHDVSEKGYYEFK